MLFVDLEFLFRFLPAAGPARQVNLPAKGTAGIEGTCISCWE